MTIAGAIFSSSQSRLYPWLFEHPGQSYHLSELRRLSGLGSASLQRELNRLTAAGLVESRSIGNLRVVRANEQSPVFAELAALTRKTLGIVPVLREALRPLQPDLKLAWVYGSIAKGSDTALSDIDVMLVGDGLRLARVVDALEPAESQLARKINPTCYTPAEFERRRAQPDSFVSRVLKQALLPLFEESPNGSA